MWITDRKLLTYAYITMLALAILATNVLIRTRGYIGADRAVDVLYLCAAAPLLNIPQVGIEQGRLSLSGIAYQAAALTLNPADATLVGLSSAIGTAGRGTFTLLGNAAFSGCIALSGSIVASQLTAAHAPTAVTKVVTVIVCSSVNFLVVAIAFRLRIGASIAGVARQMFTAPFFSALIYLSLAAILISYVLDGSLAGCVLASIVCILALALTDTIAGRRIRRVLESELSDADRHLFHSRAVEGVVHNLRNHIASAVGYLKEIDLNRLDPVDREAVETATAAANDAVTVLRSLSQGATPRVSYAPAPVDLNELVVRALGMARPRARTKEIELGLRQSSDEVRVKADPLLLREVVTNLVNNAIDAAPNHGRVELATGRRGNGWPYVSVSDNGPGVPDDNRHRLFEPHFTTKEGGTGLGLFMSYGIIREHQGDIVFSNNRPRGAVFTVMLPPFGG